MLREQGNPRGGGSSLQRTPPCLLASLGYRDHIPSGQEWLEPCNSGVILALRELEASFGGDASNPPPTCKPRCGVSPSVGQGGWQLGFGQLELLLPDGVGQHLPV